MGKIDQILMPNEKIIKKQKGVQVSSGLFGLPSGELFLTNIRLIFIHSRGWSLLSPAAGSALTGKNIEIPLKEIKLAKKGFGSVEIKANKKYSFMVTVWKAGGWIDAIQKVKDSYITTSEKMQTITENNPIPLTEKNQVLKEKEIIHMKEVIVKIKCPYCQSLYDEDLNLCPRCGAIR